LREILSADAPNRATDGPQAERKLAPFRRLRPTPVPSPVEDPLSPKLRHPYEGAPAETMTDMVKPDGTSDPAGGVVAITRPIGTEEDGTV
jgi:hypothetical protein